MICVAHLDRKSFTQACTCCFNSFSSVQSVIYEWHIFLLHTWTLCGRGAVIYCLSRWMFVSTVWCTHTRGIEMFLTCSNLYANEKQARVHPHHRWSWARWAGVLQLRAATSEGTETDFIHMSEGWHVLIKVVLFKAQFDYRTVLQKKQKKQKWKKKQKDKNFREF